jgi:tetratricopeptide (TPR) repeat protein
MRAFAVRVAGSVLDMKEEPMRVAIALTIVILGTEVLAQPAPVPEWNWPEKGKNLKILETRQLSPVMRGFTRALGVRCTYCHVGEEGKPLSTYDFVSDQNPNKDRARAMLRMLGSINDQLKAIPSSGDTRVNMWCHTCHAGRPRPLTLEEDLGETFRKSGLAATLTRYKDLRERFYGKGGYDFGERALSSFGGDFLRKGDTETAIAIFRLNTTQYPQSTLVWENLGEAYQKAGKTRLAAIFYRKALELDPQNDDAMAKLREIEAKPLE